MKTTTKIGGWAQLILEQTNEAYNASNRKNALLERLGSFFLSTVDESLTPEQRAAYLSGATIFAKEVQNALQFDKDNEYNWGAHWIQEAIEAGVPSQVYMRELDALTVKRRCNVNPEIAAKVFTAAVKAVNES